MRHKNGFWTFCCAFVPGAGQMYQGYMKRGLTHVTLFFLSLGLGLITGGLLAVLMPIIWMYSFFDTFNLRSQLMEGTAPPDDYPIQWEGTGVLRRFVRFQPRLLGWGLILCGVYALYNMFIHPLVWELYHTYNLYWLANFLDDLPSAAVALALIWLGLRLVRGKKEPEDIPYYGGQPGDIPPWQAAPSPAPDPTSHTPWADDVQSQQPAPPPAQPAAEPFTFYTEVSREEPAPAQTAEPQPEENEEERYGTDQ